MEENNPKGNEGYRELEEYALRKISTVDGEDQGSLRRRGLEGAILEEEAEVALVARNRKR